jgi:transcriptional regulator with XRE-family HTH domain
MITKTKINIELNGELLKYMRLSRNLSQRELSHKLFIAPCTLSHYEKGTRLVPTSVLADAAKILDYEIRVVDLTNNSIINKIQIERITKN